MKADGISPIILDGGDLLFTTSNIRDNNRPAELLTARKMVSGFEKIGSDAINVGSYELAAGFDVFQSILDTCSLPFISANLKHAGSNEYVLERYKIFERNGLKLGVTGVTDKLPSHVKTLKIDPFLETGITMIAELKDQVHFTVIMVNAKQDKYKQATEAFADADYIIFSGTTKQTRPEKVQPTEGPKEYMCGKQGRALTQIDINVVQIDSPLVDISSAAANIKKINTRLENLQKRDPEKTLEEIFENNKTMTALIADYRNQLMDSQKKLDNAVNTSEYTSVSMSRKVKDDPDMLTFVSNALLEIKAEKNKARKSISATNQKPPRTQH